MNERGAQLVEFAIVIPLILILLFGIMEFGYIENRQIMISNATRDAARFGSVGASSANIIAKIHSSLSFPIDDSQITITILDHDRLEVPDIEDRTNGNSIIVSIVLEDVGGLTPLGNLVSGMGKITLHSTSEFLIEGP